MYIERNIKIFYLHCNISVLLRKQETLLMILLLLTLVTLSFLLLPLARAVMAYIERRAVFKAYVANSTKETHFSIPAEMISFIPDYMRGDDMT
jgi:hypothetical protein